MLQYAPTGALWTHRQPIWQWVAVRESAAVCSMSLKTGLISFLGDSTFFHAALPGIVNAVHNQHDYTVIILDNSVTAMTGQQPNPGSEFGPNNVVKIEIEAVLRGIGVNNVVTMNAFNPKPAVDLIKEALGKSGVSAIISKGPCALYNDRQKRRARTPIIPNTVSEETCKTIYACIRDFYCPAIQLNMETKQAEILDDLCNGLHELCAVMPSFSHIQHRRCPVVKYNILLGGVGGQGLMLLSGVIGVACVDSNLKVVTSEQHGLAQRSGSISAHIRIGDAYSPLIPYGSADMIISMEAMEALRNIEYLKSGGTVITSSRLLHPVIETSTIVNKKAKTYHT